MDDLQIRNDEKKELDDLAEEMQNLIDQKDREDFSVYALQLGKNPYHRKGLSEKECDVKFQWRGSCGDSVTWFLEIENNKLIKVFFETDGCTTASIAASHCVKMVENKTIKDVRMITDKDLLKELGKFPSENFHCTTLAITSLNLTLDRYEEQQRKLNAK